MKNKIISGPILQGRILFLFILFTITSSCEKFVTVDQLADNLLAEQVFENDASANAAINGIYKNMRQYLPVVFLQRNSMLSDEVVPYSNSAGSTYYTNNLQPSDGTLPWANFYSFIYSSNNAIEKLSASKRISESKKSKYIAEAKFLRAFNYFYLINLFGDVPLVLTTDLKTNNTISRSPVSQIYEQIVTDLSDAIPSLEDDYAFAGSERIRATKLVAKAFLARVYLFTKEYSKSEQLCNEVVNSGAYTLLSTPTGIHNKNNSEAILQFGNNPTETNGTAVSGFLYTSTPVYRLTTFLLNAFEANDLRKTTWIQTKTFAGQSVSIPFKLTIRTANPPEYHTLIRLAEIYLIRAELKALRDDYQGCIDDINLIRSKHGGLTIPLPKPTTQSAALGIVLHERQVELFVESCHRWMDLKRTGKMDEVMLAEKPTTWKSTAALYPVPLSEIQRNTNLTQNPGYQ